MHIYSISTMCFWGEVHSDGLHMIHEIDDDDFGLKSEIHYIVSPEMTRKLFSIITEDDFIELCRKGGTGGMEEFFRTNEIPYRRVSGF